VHLEAVDLGLVARELVGDDRSRLTGSSESLTRNRGDVKRGQLELSES